MRLVLLLVFAGCVEYRDVTVTFGDAGEGLDGFLCKAPDGGALVDRLGAGPGLKTASLVTDLIGLENGQPMCRTGLLIQYCKDHVCAPMNMRRTCLPVELPTGIADRELLRAKVLEQLKTLSGKQLIAEAPDEFVILRMVATAQPCSEVMGSSFAFDESRLVGCIYSCPVLFDRVTEPVYLGFEGLVGVCDQGVRICASEKLNWKM